MSGVNCLWAPSTSLAPVTTAAASLAQAGAGPSSSSGHGTLLILAVILIGLGLVFFLIELLLPSGGLLGIAASISTVVGVVMLFKVDTLLGLLGAAAALIALPFLVAMGLKLWPHTPLGRVLMLKPIDRAVSGGDNDHADADESGAHDPHEAQAQGVGGLAVGMTGKAVTDLRPVGVCMIEGKREPCMAVVSMIEAGTAVRVVHVDGMHTKVAPADAQARASSEAANEAE